MYLADPVNQYTQIDSSDESQHTIRGTTRPEAALHDGFRGGSRRGDNTHGMGIKSVGQLWEKSGPPSKN